VDVSGLYIHVMSKAPSACSEENKAAASGDLRVAEPQVSFTDYSNGGWRPMSDKPDMSLVPVLTLEHFFHSKHSTRSAIRGIVYKFRYASCFCWQLCFLFGKV